MYVYLMSSVKLNLREILQRHHQANHAFSINMFGHTVVCWHLPERYRQTKCAL